ncbi:MAG TPA: type II toxin-antitoxin system RelE/ParE family toxin [Dehalococcoidia bacterium]|nr:type II toxin-antitoxin system RelE/ParE family toxin [Dehalococcoidia bacterium]
MSYQVRIVPNAEREMDKLPTSFHTRISKKMLSLEDNPRPRGAKKLSGREEYRLRVGDYRVLYTIDDKGRIVTIFAVGHRREIYH